jgi:hypothetical protein
MNKVNESAGRQFGEGMQMFVKMANVFYSKWKPLVTAMRPQYHERNLVSSSFNNFLALGTEALNPDTQKMAAAVAGVGRGSSAAMEGLAESIAGATTTINGKTYTARELYDLMTKHNAVGIFNHTDTNDLSQSMIQDVITKQRGGTLGQWTKNVVNPVTGLRAWAGAGKEVGNSIEQYVRATNFIGFMKRGYSPDDAAEMVAKYHFDYQDLTDVEKFIKGIGIPFYTWLRKNIPLQLESILNDPRPYEAVWRASQSGASIENMDYENVPTYLQKNMAIPLGRTDDNRVRLWDFGLPLGDLQTSASDLATGVNPIVKMMYEAKSGRSLLTGAPTRSYEGQESVDLINKMGGRREVPEVVQDALLSKPGIAATAAGKYILNNSGVFRDIANYGLGEPSETQVVQQGRARSDIENPALKFLGSQFDPNFTKYYSPEAAQRSKQYDYERQLSNIIQMLKARGYPVRTINEMK